MTDLVTAARDADQARHGRASKIQSSDRDGTELLHFVPDFNGNIGEDVFFASIVELNKRLLRERIQRSRTDPRILRPAGKVRPALQRAGVVVAGTGDSKGAEVDGELKRERYRGPLQGIPFGAKDLLSVAGQITTWGAKPYAAQVFDYDAAVITKLAKAGRHSDRKALDG